MIIPLDYTNPTNFDDLEMDWDNPIPNDWRYLQALLLAVSERQSATGQSNYRHLKMSPYNTFGSFRQNRFVESIVRSDTITTGLLYSSYLPPDYDITTSSILPSVTPTYVATQMDDSKYRRLNNYSMGNADWMKWEKIALTLATKAKIAPIMQTERRVGISNITIGGVQALYNDALANWNADTWTPISGFNPIQRYRLYSDEGRCIIENVRFKMHLPHYDLSYDVPTKGYGILTSYGAYFYNSDGFTASSNYQLIQEVSSPTEYLNLSDTWYNEIPVPLQYFGANPFNSAGSEWSSYIDVTDFGGEGGFNFK